MILRHDIRFFGYHQLTDRPIIGYSVILSASSSLVFLLLLLPLLFIQFHSIFRSRVRCHSAQNVSKKTFCIRTKTRPYTLDTLLCPQSYAGTQRPASIQSSISSEVTPVVLGNFDHFCGVTRGNSTNGQKVLKKTDIWHHLRHKRFDNC